MSKLPLIQTILIDKSVTYFHQEYALQQVGTMAEHQALFLKRRTKKMLK